MHLSTPKYDLHQFAEVYEPSEDTFLLIDALETEFSYLQGLKPKTVVEIGSGSGVVITTLFQIFSTTCAYFATDINPQCCLATKSTSTLNGINVECLNMDLLNNFKKNVFDVILFNPPYVLTESEEISGNGLNLAWAGGNKGRVISDKVIKNLPDLLSNNGVCYMVLLRENNIEDIINIVENYGFKSEMVMDRKIPGEHLYVYKFCKRIV